MAMLVKCKQKNYVIVYVERIKRNVRHDCFST